MNRARPYLAVTLGVTCVTAYFSAAYFHVDEYFQVLELVRFKLGEIGEPLPWEHVERLRPWLQPFLYYCVATALGVRDTFRLAFVARLVTGLANVGALALLLRTTLPWLGSEREQRFHVRVLTLLGFFPYLFVRTSSESASMAALTAGFAVLLAGATRDGARWTAPLPPRSAVLGGFLLGLAFELRFQTAFASLGIAAWLGVVARRRALLLLPGGLGAVVLGALADRWGYGAWELPAWTYFRANLLEGAAGMFGTDPPFSYLWLTPANVFLPVVVAVMIAVAVAWRRNLRHPLTAATLPFVVVHNLIAHKEERFLFPVAVLVVALVSLTTKPGRWLKPLAVYSTAMMALLAFVPLGWHTHVRFTRWVHEHLGDDFHAVALPEIDLNLPPFRPRVYDVEKADAAEIVRRLDAREARTWLIADRPILTTGTSLDERAVLVYSELPGYADPAWRARAMRWVDAYNAAARPPLRKVHYRSLYRLDR
ncbi:MAG: hypothetical protein KIT84_12785 [Labilithrix sp.]|nr:hypothetical protein [Labilithrix sp.]MCW5811891.1 hypothetical protein [Labilithrix sp.]